MPHSHIHRVLEPSQWAKELCTLMARQTNFYPSTQLRCPYKANELAPNIIHSQERIEITRHRNCWKDHSIIICHSVRWRGGKTLALGWWTYQNRSFSGLPSHLFGYLTLPSIVLEHTFLSNDCKSFYRTYCRRHGSLCDCCVHFWHSSVVKASIRYGTGPYHLYFAP